MKRAISNFFGPPQPLPRHVKRANMYIAVTSDGLQTRNNNLCGYLMRTGSDSFLTWSKSAEPNVSRINMSRSERYIMKSIQINEDANDYIRSQRGIVRRLLPTLTRAAGDALRDARLDYPVFLTIPKSGDAIVFVITPLDPPDSDWQHICAIVRDLIAAKLNNIRLRSRELICVAASDAGATADAIPVEGE